MRKPWLQARGLLDSQLPNHPLTPPPPPRPRRCRIFLSLAKTFWTTGHWMHTKSKIRVAIPRKETQAAKFKNNKLQWHKNELRSINPDLDSSHYHHPLLMTIIKIHYIYYIHYSTGTGTCYRHFFYKFMVLWMKPCKQKFTMFSPF